MKPLTIEQLKSLEVGDWVWIVDLIAKQEEGFILLPDREFYYEKASVSIERKDTVFECVGGTVKRRVALYFSDYGTKWLAYKNKEQAESKGEIVELPCGLGQRLYAVYDSRIYEYFAEEINVNEDGRFIFETPTLFPKRLIFGEDVFTDKAEAERRLAELKGE